jgi:Lamin Tail Domain
MSRIRLLAPLLVLAALLGAAGARGAGPAGIAVGQVFAAGGNSGAAYADDYVVLFDRATAPVDLAGWTLQYASAGGTSWQATPLSGTIDPGGSYLVQLGSGGSTGAQPPPPDASGSTNLAVSGGKVALVRDSATLSCGDAPGSCSAVSTVEDLVGYGAASDYEGSGPAPAPAADTALVRAGGGCTDGDDNAADFSAGTPAPAGSSSPASPCSVPPPPAAGTATHDAAVEATIQPLVSISLDRASLSFGTILPGDTPAPLAEGVTVTSNDPAGYALSVHRSAFAPHDLPLGIGVSLPAGASPGGAPSGGALAALPIPPAADLLLGSTASPSADGGDAWRASVGFVSPIPVVESGRYTATVTFTVIGR